MSRTRKKDTKRRGGVEPESTGKLTVRETTEEKDDYTWKTFLVRGWREADGRYGRKKFKSREEAETFMALKNVELMNAETAMHNVVTWLTHAQVKDAEAAFTRLSGRYSLGQAADYLLTHFAPPDKAVPLDKARDAFISAQEKGDVRARSLRQSRSTLRKFIGFATLQLLPEELQSEIERVRSEITREQAATPKEVVRRLDPALRPAGRKAAEEAEDVTSMLLRGKLDPVLREAIATARDEIEARRAPADWETAERLVASVDGARIPGVHEITTSLVEAFLESLRAKDGTSAAARKTWNNFRADLHVFFGWCSGKQRRWATENCVSAVRKFKVGRGVPPTLSVAQARELMDYVATYKGGAMAKYFALALFAGPRTDPDGELIKLNRHPDREKLIDLKCDVIRVLPEIAKENEFRKTNIRNNLHEWLVRFPGEIWPKNGDRMLKHIRARFALPRDVLRNSFFSFLVAAEKSVENAALEGGNKEGVLRAFYLNLANTDDAEEFWRILPPGAEKGS